MVVALRRFRELDGCLIGYEGEGESRVLQPQRPVSSSYRCVAVVIEEVQNDDPTTTAELGNLADSSTWGLPSIPTAVSNRSRLAPELVGASVSCGLTMIAAVGLVAGVAGEVVTAGASTFVTVASWTGLTMGGVQCLNGLVRIGAIYARPDDNTLQRWDSAFGYATTMLVVDAIGVASGLSSLPFAARNLFATLARQRAFIARGMSFESLRAMNRLQRMRAVSEVFEDAAKTPGGRSALVKAAREAGVGVNSFQRLSGVSVRHADTLRRVIADETVRRISSTLRDVFTSTAITAASATPASLTGSASGSVNYVIHLLDAGVPRR
jgi:hypothetical protein